MAISPWPHTVHGWRGAGGGVGRRGDGRTGEEGAIGIDEVGGGGGGVKIVDFSVPPSMCRL